MQDITTHGVRQATQAEEQQRAELSRAFLERFQRRFEQQPRGGILHFRGWPAEGEPLDRIEDPELAERVARAKVEDDHEAELERRRDAALAAGDEPPGDRPDLAEQLEHTTPARSPSSPRPPPGPSAQVLETDVVERGGKP